MSNRRNATTTAPSPDPDELSYAAAEVFDAKGRLDALNDRVLAGDNTVSSAEFAQAEAELARKTEAFAFAERFTRRRRKVNAERSAAAEIVELWAELPEVLDVGRGRLNECMAAVTAAVCSLIEARAPFADEAAERGRRLALLGVAAGLLEREESTHLLRPTSRTQGGIDGVMLLEANQGSGVPDVMLLLAEAIVAAGVRATLPSEYAAAGTFERFGQSVDYVARLVERSATSSGRVPG